jgi:hypothetical protein
VTLSSSSAAGAFSVSPEGPWSPTLSVDVPAGASSVSIYYRDTAVGTPTLTARAAGRENGSQVETVQAGPLASIAVTPSSASIALGSSATFTASGADAYGNPVTPAATWTASGGSVSPTSGPTTTFTPSAAGTATVTASANGVSAVASVTVTATPAKVSSITYSWSGSWMYMTIATVPNATVGYSITRNSAPFASGSVSSGSTGKVTLRVTTRRGCYATTVTSLTATGYTWDGTTPANARCF